MPPALLFRHAAQVRRCPQVRSDRDRSSHRSLLATPGDHKPITQGIPPESPQGRGGMRRPLAEALANRKSREEKALRPIWSSKISVEEPFLRGGRMA